MSTVTYQPNAAGSYTQMPYTDPADSVHYEMVNDSSNAALVGNQSSIYRTDTYAFANPSQTGTINKITVYARMWNNCGYEAYVYGRVAIFTSGQTLKYGNVVTMDTATSYYDTSKEWSTNPWSLAGWTWDDLNALEIGVSLKGYNGVVGAECPYVYLVIDYTANKVACCSSCIVM